MTIVLKFYNPNYTAASGTLTFNGARLYTPEPLAPLGQTRYSSLSVSGGGSLSVPATQLFPYLIPGYATKTITVSGLPDVVTYGQLRVDATFVANGQTAWTTGGYQTWETVYETQSAPVGLQAIPWTDLFALACAWAHGEDGDDADVLKELTFGLFWSALWVYDPERPYFTEQSEETGAISYDLTKLLQGTTPNMDCQDASGLLHLAAAANGVASELTVVTSDDEGFWTNPLCGLGNDASQIGPYESFPFAFHQVLVSAAVFDAACAQLTNLSGGWYRNPPAGSNWPVTGYWQTEASEGFFYGLAHSYYADPMPEDPEEVGLYSEARELSAIF